MQKILFDPFECFWKQWIDLCPRREAGLPLGWLEARVPRAVELLRILAERQGQILRAAPLGRLLGVSGPTVRRRVDVLCRVGLVRLLPHIPEDVCRQAAGELPPALLRRSLIPYRRPTGARPGRLWSGKRARQPRVYLRDPGLVRELAGDRNEPAAREALYRGCLVEGIASWHERRFPGSLRGYWSTPRGRRIDLVVETPAGRIGFNMLWLRVPQPWDWNTLRFAWQRGLIRRSFLLHTGRRGFVTARAVTGLPWGELIGDPEGWIDGRRRLGEVNERACAAWREACPDA